MKVSIIIPVYNEFRTFSQVLERVRCAPLPEGCSKEIIVIDDGSTDGTSQMIAGYARAGDIITGHHTTRNFGKGTAIRTGIALASGDILLTQDGDLEYDPDRLCSHPGTYRERRGRRGLRFPVSRQTRWHGNSKSSRQLDSRPRPRISCMTPR